MFDQQPVGSVDQVPQTNHRVSRFKVGDRIGEPSSIARDRRRAVSQAVVERYARSGARYTLCRDGNRVNPLDEAR